MKRDEVMAMMKALQLRGMMASYDEVLLEAVSYTHLTLPTKRIV